MRYVGNQVFEFGRNSRGQPVVGALPSYPREYSDVSLKEEIASWPEPKRGWEYRNTGVSTNVQPPILISGRGGNMVQLEGNQLRHSAVTHTWWHLVQTQKGR